MKRLIVILFFIPIFVFSQDHIVLIGNVFDGITFFPIKEANIYNFNSKKYCFTNNDGNFEILVTKGDTLVITKPIYKQVLIEITDEIMNRKALEISVYYKVITLKEVNVYALPSTYEGFRKEFLNTNLSNYYTFIEGVNLSDQQRIQTNSGNLLSLIPGKVGQAVTHPISFLYDTFSRKAKLGRLYQKLVENQDEVDNLPKKYNRELVTYLTGLEGDELLDFMTYCKFSYYDLIRWSPEFIVLQIQKKFNDYEYYQALKDY
jgi:hypothetical protein